MGQLIPHWLIEASSVQGHPVWGLGMCEVRYYDLISSYMFILIHTTLFPRCAVGFNHWDQTRDCRPWLLRAASSTWQDLHSKSKVKASASHQSTRSQGPQQSRDNRAPVRREASPSTGHTGLEEETRILLLSANVCTFARHRNCLRMQVTHAWPWTLPQLFLNIIFCQVQPQEKP